MRCQRPRSKATRSTLARRPRQRKRLHGQHVRRRFPPQSPECKRRRTMLRPRTLDVCQNVLNAAEIIAWAKGRGFETAAPSRRSARDDRLFLPAGRLVRRRGVVVAQAGDRRWRAATDGAVRRRPGFAVRCLDLRWRHREIIEAGATRDHPEYQLHITISYGDKRPLTEIEPYRCEILLGRAIFEEVNADCERCRRAVNGRAISDASKFIEWGRANLSSPIPEMCQISIRWGGWHGRFVGWGCCGIISARFAFDGRYRDRSLAGGR